MTVAVEVTQLVSRTYLVDVPDGTSDGGLLAAVQASNSATWRHELDWDRDADWDGKSDPSTISKLNADGDVDGDPVWESDQVWKSGE